MPEYRFRGKDLEDLTREELIEALRQALDLLHERTGDAALLEITPPLSLRTITTRAGEFIREPSASPAATKEPK